MNKKLENVPKENPREINAVIETVKKRFQVILTFRTVKDFDRIKDACNAEHRSIVNQIKVLIENAENYKPDGKYQKSGDKKKDREKKHAIKIEEDYYWKAVGIGSKYRMSSSEYIEFLLTEFANKRLAEEE